MKVNPYEPPQIVEHKKSTPEPSRKNFTSGITILVILAAIGTFILMILMFVFRIYSR